MPPYVITSFYKFVTLPDYETMKPALLSIMNQNRLLGTIILAHEGINGSVSGQPDDIAHLYSYLKNDSRFHDLWFKETLNPFIPFEKAKVKIRQEIVTLGVDGLNSFESQDTYVAPEAWNELISDPNVLLIDTRNDYEYNLGTFENAINPKTANFREFPDYVQSHLINQKNKKIAMFCTGGIRCEKSTAYLKQLGFESVYQLHGGILNYLENIPEKDSKWKGTCFVFDDRIAIEPLDET